MSGPTRSQGARRLAYILLVIPFVATLFPQIYASGGPTLFGAPFFYWYQFVWIALSGGCIGAAYLLTRTAPPA